MKSSATSSSNVAERWVRALLLATVAVAAAGCSVVAKREAMETGGAARAARPLGDAVRVDVVGGSADILRTLRSEDLKAAVESSLLRAGLFRSTSQGEAGHVLTGSMVEMRAPPGGFTMSSEVEIAWTLLRRSDNSVLFRRALATSHTLGVSDALGGATRARMVVEGAARKNIEALLQELSRLPAP